MANKISLHQLTDSFYNEHAYLQEIMDKNKDGTFKDKGRGYGILLVDVKGFKFAIPLRSNMNHKENYAVKIYTDKNGKKLRKGLDYSKAIIITEERFISSDVFFIPNHEFMKIVKAENHIIKSFEKYVNKYVKAVLAQDHNVLRQYNFSTLKNYHNELGCE
ncbi:hypothetical protein P4561_07365 [Priestia flexa]|uniref:type III toxin-antitoxin system TenpIN family toxin n=1 Tax=Priestia flexa TaxID=86664 RepID=UPI00240E5186|nr:hypothetical protein [Priestia flexa]MED3823541.1 hypothetical protein [Priestia flexa]WEZ10420.1 hypothetical protein P5663_21085 [Priestia flexa]